VAAAVETPDLHRLAGDVRVGREAKDDVECRQEGAEAAGVVSRPTRDLVRETLDGVEVIHGGKIPGRRQS
jgi:hypothetical protein